MLCFDIIGISRVNNETVRVEVKLSASVWAQADRDRELESLYEDIGKRCSRLHGVKSLNAPVNADDDNPINGVKYLRLFYLNTTWVAAPNNVIRVDFISKKRIAA